MDGDPFGRNPLFADCPLTFGWEGAEAVGAEVTLEAF
jgi:hypothetical protein